MNASTPILLALSLVSSAGANAQTCQFAPSKAATAQAQFLAQEAQKTNPCVLVPGLTAKSLSSVWTSLMSSGVTGGKRFETVPPAGSPTGRVLASADGVPFDLRSLAAEGVLAVQVRTDKAAALSFGPPFAAVLVVPLQQLKPGANHDWTITTRSATYRGSFEVLEAQEAEAVRSQLDAVERASLSAQARLLYKAAVLDEAELYGERDQVLTQLRALVTP